MADHSKPTTTSTYVNFVSELDGRLDDISVGLDPAVTTATNLATNSIRWTSASNKWQKYNGTTWADLSSAYSININGTVGATTPASGAFTTLSATGNVTLGDASGDTVTINGTVGAGVVISGSTATDALRITQTGAGNALVVEDSTNPDSTPFVVDASGNVGIGTSSPAYKLSIQVSAGTTSFYTTDAATSDLMITPGISSGVVRVGPVSGAMALYTANTERMRIDNSGNVGIGTTSPSSYGGKLTVLSGSTALSGYFESTDTSTYSATSFNAGSRIAIRGSNSTTNAYQSIRFSNSAAGNFEGFFGGVLNSSGYCDFVWQSYNGSYAERMRIDSSGRVGIGTASPAVKLAVSSTDAILVPVGTTAQRPTGATGYIRYNTSTSSFEGYNGTVWGNIGGGATGGGTDTVFYLNSKTVSTTYSIPSGQNASCVGPITVSSGATVTVPSGSRWVVL